jgi:hypothetical protein
MMAAPNFFVDFLPYCSYHSLNKFFLTTMITKPRPFKRVNPANFDFATALRNIGQDLARRGLKSFDIRFDGEEFIALCGYQEPPAATPVELKYRPSDIKELDEAGENRRDNVEPPKDFLNQPQVFRTIGEFLDSNEAQLVRLSNNDRRAQESTFIIEYISRDGERVIDDRTGAAIYDMCVAMYKQRRRLTENGGRRRSK